MKQRNPCLKIFVLTLLLLPLLASSYYQSISGDPNLEEPPFPQLSSATSAHLLRKAGRAYLSLSNATRQSWLLEEAGNWEFLALLPDLQWPHSPDNPGYDMIQPSGSDDLITVGARGSSVFLAKTRLGSHEDQSTDLQATEGPLQTQPILFMSPAPTDASWLVTGPAPQLWDSATMTLLKQSSPGIHFKNIVCLDAVTCIGLKSSGELEQLDISGEQIRSRAYDEDKIYRYKHISLMESRQTLVGLTSDGKLILHDLGEVARGQRQELELESGIDLLGVFDSREDNGKYYLLAGGHSNELWTIQLSFTGLLASLKTERQRLEGLESNWWALFLSTSNKIVAWSRSKPWPVHYFEKKPCDSTCLTCNGGTPEDCLSCGAKRYLQKGACLECLEGCERCSSGADCRECSPGHMIHREPEKEWETRCEPLGMEGVPRRRLQTCGSWQYEISPGPPPTCGNCDDTCAECNGPNSTSCTSCYDGDYLDSGSCNQCDSNCHTCSAFSTCTSCEGHSGLT
jgi:hypothetical protein